MLYGGSYAYQSTVSDNSNTEKQNKCLIIVIFDFINPNHKSCLINGPRLPHRPQNQIYMALESDARYHDLEKNRSF